MAFTRSTVTLLALLVAGLVPFAPTGAAEEPDVETHSCDMTSRTLGTVLLESCSVSAYVENGFQMKVQFYQGNTGNVLLEARSEHGTRVTFTCALAAEAGVCSPGVFLGPLYQGEWTFTAEPVVGSLYANPPQVTLAVDVW